MNWEVAVTSQLVEIATSQRIKCSHGRVSKSMWSYKCVNKAYYLHKSPLRTILVLGDIQTATALTLLIDKCQQSQHRLPASLPTWKTKHAQSTGFIHVFETGGYTIAAFSSSIFISNSLMKESIHLGKWWKCYATVFSSSSDCQFQHAGILQLNKDGNLASQVVQTQLSPIWYLPEVPDVSSSIFHNFVSAVKMIMNDKSGH